MKARILSSIIIGLVWATCPLSFAAPDPRSSPRPSPSPSPRPTDPPAKNTCCFCISPPKDGPDAERFLNECQTCLPQKFPGCDVYKTFRADEYNDAVIKDLGCSGRVNIMNNQHGPDLSQAQDIIRVCSSAYPTCNINLLDLSCGSYTNETDAQRAIATIRTTVGSGVSVEICGSGSINVFLNCTSYRITKTYVISPSGSQGDLGLCPEFGTACWDIGERFKCKDTLGRMLTIPCCKIGVEGYWGNSGGCDGRGCTEQRCPMKTFCAGNSLNMQGCSSLGPKGVCMKLAADCSNYGQVCGKKNDAIGCIPRPSPSASPSPSPR